MWTGHKGVLAYAINFTELCQPVPLSFLQLICHQLQLASLQSSFYLFSLLSFHLLLLVATASNIHIISYHFENTCITYITSQ